MWVRRLVDWIWFSMKRDHLLPTRVDSQALAIAQARLRLERLKRHASLLRLVETPELGKREEP